MTMVDNIWMILMEFLDKAGDRDTHCNALALIRMAQDFCPVEKLDPG